MTTDSRFFSRLSLRRKIYLCGSLKLFDVLMKLNLEINITDRGVYALLAVVVLLGLTAGVYAYQSGSSPEVMGHSGEEIEVTVDGEKKLLTDALSELENASSDFKSGRVSHGDTIEPIDGYSRSNCSLIVSIEDDHRGSHYSGSWSDTGTWYDNHYGGSQAYYNSSWQLWCRHGFSNSDSDDPPDWEGAKCRYMMVCG